MSTLYRVTSPPVNTKTKIKRIVTIPTTKHLILSESVQYTDKMCGVLQTQITLHMVASAG
ncbi:MAG: hypothetical protein Q4A63_01085 [Butyricicoccus pullicaecorum]|nr:hypothetical protein [Butyricicoccus pullicaecorum]